jgi:1-deoxy-D-xylulose 5-phosphate reductoisomerase
VAVEAFLEGEISWQQIGDVCNAALDRHDLGMPTSVDEVVAADSAARRVAHDVVAGLVRVAR